ncbi:MAG: hypothetical protein ACK5M7_02495 [Draconibacterium sp.]
MIPLDKDLQKVKRNIAEFGEITCEEIKNTLFELRNIKRQEQLILSRHLYWYQKIINPIDNNTGAKNESNELAERKVAKLLIKRILTELKNEESKLSNYVLTYENLSNEKLNIDLNRYKNQYYNPENEDNKLTKINGLLRIRYDDIVEKYVHPSSQNRFKDSEDYIALAKEILPEVFARRIINNETEILHQIREYLNEITDKYTEFSDVKLNILKEIFTDVRDESINYLTEIAEISNYFSQNDCQISQGIKLSINHKLSDAYPLAWIDNFIDRLEEKATYTDLFKSLGEKISIEEMMREAYIQCGGKKHKLN